MPRPPRFVIPGVPHHITQRGNYRQNVFFREEDRRFYLDLLRDYSRHHGVSILAYCLMPNHVHLIAVPHEPESLSRLLQRVHGDYARATHLRLRRTGHLWESRFHSVPMDDEHFWHGMVYVEQNPVRAGLADSAEEWRWSSATAHLADRDEGLLDLVRWRAAQTPESWKNCLSLGLRDAMLIERIRESTLKGWPLGDEEFLDLLESLGYRARRAKSGPKPQIA